MSTLYQQWQDLAYDETADRSQLEKFWGTYFQIEKEIYEKLLSNPDEVVKGCIRIPSSSLLWKKSKRVYGLSHYLRRSGLFGKSV